MSDKRNIPVAVVCYNCAGEPEVCMTKISVTSEQVFAGEHYEIAKLQALNRGFGPPMVAFDPAEIGHLEAIRMPDSEDVLWTRKATADAACFRETVMETED